MNKDKRAASVDEYLKYLDNEERNELQRLREIVRKEVPEAEESISYGMPAFKYKGKPLIYFGAFKDHLSIFPTPDPIENLKKKLKPYEAGKGTLKYKLNEPFPEQLLKEILQARLSQLR